MRIAQPKMSRPPSWTHDAAWIHLTWWDKNFSWWRTPSWIWAMLQLASEPTGAGVKPEVVQTLEVTELASRWTEARLVCPDTSSSFAGTRSGALGKLGCCQIWWNWTAQWCCWPRCHRARRASSNWWLAAVSCQKNPAWICQPEPVTGTYIGHRRNQWSCRCRRGWWQSRCLGHGLFHGDHKVACQSPDCKCNGRSLGPGFRGRASPPESRSQEPAAALLFFCGHSESWHWQSCSRESDR